MAKKNKNQKRKAKVKAKNKQHFHFQSVKELFRIDINKLAITFPNPQKRKEYLQALYDDFDRRLA